MKRKKELKGKDLAVELPVPHHRTEGGLAFRERATGSEELRKQRKDEKTAARGNQEGEASPEKRATEWT